MVCEDNGSSLIATEIGKNYENWDVYCSYNWLDIRSWVELDPGAKTFDAFVFDLFVPTYGLPILNGQAYDVDRDGSPSLYYINNFFVEQFSELKNRIIICSAFFEHFMEKKKEHLYADYIKISKYDENYPNNLIDKINELANLKRG